MHIILGILIRSGDDGITDLKLGAFDRKGGSCILVRERSMLSNSEIMRSRKTWPNKVKVEVLIDLAKLLKLGDVEATAIALCQGRFKPSRWDHLKDGIDVIMAATTGWLIIISTRKKEKPVVDITVYSIPSVGLNLPRSSVMFKKANRNIKWTKERPGPKHEHHRDSRIPYSVNLLDAFHPSH